MFSLILKISEAGLWFIEGTEMLWSWRLLSVWSSIGVGHEKNDRFWLLSPQLEKVSHQRVSTPMNDGSIWKEKSSSEVGMVVRGLFSHDVPGWVLGKTQNLLVLNLRHPGGSGRNDVGVKGDLCLLQLQGTSNSTRWPCLDTWIPPRWLHWVFSL